MSRVSDEVEPLRSSTQSSFIYEKRPNLGIRILRIIDIFSFLPVPKDEAVSTKQSIIGSLLLLTLFLAYVIYDFVDFVYNNAPIEQLYRTALDNQFYPIPQFSIAFMTGGLNNITDTYDNVFTYQMINITKSQGSETNGTINYFVSQFNTTGNNLTWMSDATKAFYYIQRYPTQDMQAKGLLYSTDQNTYVRVKISYCSNVTNTTGCASNDTMNQLSNFGRFFLFIRNDPDKSVISKESLATNGNNYLLYNFFVIPGFYKRVNINFQVIETTVLPDYFNQFTESVTTQLQIQSIFQEISVVNYNSSNTDALAFNMQLSPIKLKNKVSRSTIIDHLSLWGALWGVLFAVFALIFLQYNRSKFYKKNPDWDKFKKALQLQRKQQEV